METKKMNICLLGDIHGSYQRLCSIICYYRPDIVIVLGDFGYFPRFIDWKYAIPDSISDKCKIYFLDGNHEDHGELRKIAPRGTFTPVEIAKNLFYLPRGTTLTLPDGRIVFVAGGAKSIDRHMRTEGFDWFPDEILDRKDLPKILPHADIVLSHTLPWNIYPCEFNGPLDPSCYVLQEVFEDVKPRLWFAGHFHTSAVRRERGTEFRVLSDVKTSFCSRDVPDFLYVLSGSVEKRKFDGWVLPDGTNIPCGKIGVEMSDIMKIPDDLMPSKPKSLFSRVGRKKACEIIDGIYTRLFDRKKRR